MDSRKIDLPWNWYVDTTKLGNREVSSAINDFLTTTIGSGHVKKIYRRKIPTVLVGAKVAKSLRASGAKFNEATFKEFWEADGGQVCLSTVRNIDFHNHVEALEEDPGYENFNYVN